MQDNNFINKSDIERNLARSKPIPTGWYLTKLVNLVYLTHTTWGQDQGRLLDNPMYRATLEIVSKSNGDLIQAGRKATVLFVLTDDQDSVNRTKAKLLHLLDAAGAPVTGEIKTRGDLVVHVQNCAAEGQLKTFKSCIAIPQDEDDNEHYTYFHTLIRAVQIEEKEEEGETSLG